MGNYISCTLSGPVGKSSRRGTKVIFPSGEIRRIYELTKAAELMLETPNYFLVNTKSLQIGKRFNALNADEDLEIGNVYVFFPMRRLNSVVMAADMGSLFLAANSAAKRGSLGCVRISPECGGDSQSVVSRENIPVTKLNLDDIEEFSTPEFKHRLSVCRSKKPLLETIVEEPHLSIEADLPLSGFHLSTKADLPLPVFHLSTEADLPLRLQYLNTEVDLPLLGFHLSTTADLPLRLQHLSTEADLRRTIFFTFLPSHDVRGTGFVHNANGAFIR
ncbi:hypothetical protein BUALT_Bualt04G0087000 [Buddleja alternifolia]|uniref:Uncharacterized protein n=1 Tax=Buddleja alternifolia TaxID=168488 RepID=A0AAV6XVI8_9LAMI|nr:hypothetical protein BUALT_Bualt04G0087000 [Buddleja alternifolia]